MDGMSGFWELADVIGGGEPDKAATRTGTVSRIDADGTAYVRFPGADIDMPVYLSVVDVKPGDMVNVRIENGRASIPGNVSSPSVGVQRMQAVEELAQDTAEESARTAQAVVNARQVADEANKVAQATNQHFFADDSGAHITDVTQDEWSAAVDDNFSDYEPDTRPYHNQLLNSLGILLRTALNNLVSITRSAIAFYDGTGNESSNIVARFGADGAQIGLNDESHLALDYHSIRMVDKDGVSYLHVSDLRDSDGFVTDDFEGNGVATTFTLSARAENTASMVVSLNGQVVTSGITKSTVSVRFSTAPGNGVAIAIKYLPDPIYSEWIKAYTFGRRLPLRPVGLGSLAEGYDTTASGIRSHAEGTSTTASGSSSHAEGYGTTASGSYSHAEGYRTTANAVYGACSHSEGAETTASGGYSHAEGYGSVSSGNHSHAEGTYVVSSGAASHAQNKYTIAASEAQTAMGKYNEEDTNATYALIIGNGTADNARSNALAVKWDGTIDTPSGYSITPVILYDDDTTALNVAITLSETAANFSRLTICYRTNDNDYASVDVWHPDGKTVSLTATRTAGNSTTPTVWLKSKTVLISGTTINTTTSGTNYYLTSQTRADGNQTATNSNYIAVTQVIGYR